jgi:hypothetical protein
MARLWEAGGRRVAGGASSGQPVAPAPKLRQPKVVSSDKRRALDRKVAATRAALQAIRENRVKTTGSSLGPTTSKETRLQNKIQKLRLKGATGPEQPRPAGSNRPENYNQPSVNLNKFNEKLDRRFTL